MTHLNIGIRLAIGFGIVLFLTLIVGLKAITEMQYLATNIIQIHKHPLAVSNAVRDIRADIIAMHRSMKDVALAKNLGQITKAANIVNQYEQKVYHSFKLVFQRFLGDKRDVKRAQLAFSEWKMIRDEVIYLMEHGEKDKAANITKEKGAQHVEEMNQKIQVMIDFASNKADSFFKNAQENSQWAISVMIILLTLTFLSSMIIAITITFSIVTPLIQIVAKIKKVATGDLSQDIKSYRNDEIGELARSTYTMIDTLANVVSQINTIAEGDYQANIAPRSDKDTLGIALQKMTEKLRQISAENQHQNWLKTGQTELNNVMRGDLNQKTFSHNVITYIAQYLKGQVATLYLYDDSRKVLKLTASYAFKHRKGVNNICQIGEGLIGQAALEQKMITVTDVPEDYISISSGLGYAAPKNIIIAPILYENILKGVIELGLFHPISEQALQFLSLVTENIAISLISAQSRTQMTDLLEQSQRQTEELATQQEELMSTNEELEKRTQALEDNETSLRQQQNDLELANSELEDSRKEVDKKAEEVEISSRCKSDFLANMSHELRTPLNSLLILSQQLAENEDGNLTIDQVESAKIVYNAGQDLLHLINEILDLSKIESGKMSLVLQNVILKDLGNMLESNFKPIAEQKELVFQVTFAEDIPETFETDPQRLSQVLKNLLSNAFKFTTKGRITLHFNINEHQLEISVIDTGLGIPKDKQAIIFEAFQQVDGSTARQYGGTGLGLSISKELARLLDGEIRCQSIENKGSTFTLLLPLKQVQHTVAPLIVSPPLKNIEDDQEEKIYFKNKNILIVDDDMRNLFALSSTLQKKGLSVHKAANGEKALEMLEQQSPTIDLVVMDIMMPIMDGYETMRIIRGKTKFRNLPIIALTAKAMKDDRNKCLAAGANDYLTKPVDLKKLFSLIQVWLHK